MHRGVAPPSIRTIAEPAPDDLPDSAGGGGCTNDDPTSSGCLTTAMLNTYRQVLRKVGGRWPWGATCWDAHAWNPTSDHPRGRACDFTVGHELIGGHL